MAHKPEIQYVRYYSAGSAAKALRSQPVQPEPLPKQVKIPEKRILVPFDSISVFGTAVALVMLVCMLVGIFQLTDTNREIARTQSTISALKAENTRLQLEYQESYDLDTVKTAAASMGMIPKEQARRITIKIPEPVVEEKTTWWESFVMDFMGLFA